MERDMILKNTKWQNKKNRLEKLLMDNKIYAFDSTNIGQALKKSEKNYNEAVFQRDLKYFIMPVALAVMGAYWFCGFSEHNVAVTTLGAIGLATTWFYGKESIIKYKNSRGVKGFKNHSREISEKFDAYEKELDNCIKRIENLPFWGNSNEK